LEILSDVRLVQIHRDLSSDYLYTKTRRGGEHNGTVVSPQSKHPPDAGKHFEGMFIMRHSEKFVLFVAKRTIWWGSLLGKPNNLLLSGKYRLAVAASAEDSGTQHSAFF